MFKLSLNTEERNLRHGDFLREGLRNGSSFITESSKTVSQSSSV